MDYTPTEAKQLQQRVLQHVSSIYSLDVHNYFITVCLVRCLPYHLYVSFISLVVFCSTLFNIAEC